MKTIDKMLLLIGFLLCGYVAAAQSGGYFRKPMKFDKAGKAEYKSYSVDQWLEHRFVFPKNYADTVVRMFRVHYTVSPFGQLSATIDPADESDPLYRQLNELLTDKNWEPALYRRMRVTAFSDSLNVRIAYPKIKVRPARSAAKKTKKDIETEQMPEYPGGKQALQAFLGENLRYRKEWMAAGMVGAVRVSYVVSEKGEIENVNILNTPHTEFAHEVMRVLSLMPRWEPGRQNGEAVAVRFTMPVTFSMTSSGSNRASSQTKKYGIQY